MPIATTSSGKPLLQPPATGNGATIIPYLFGGLGLLLGVIAIALITLACSSRKKRHPSLPPSASAGKQGSAVDDPQEAAPEVLRIAVINPGDDKPTFLATAVPVNPPPATTAVLVNPTPAADSQV